MISIKEMTVKTSKLVTIFILLFAVVNLTQSNTFSEWDQNSDDKLSKSEFQANFSAEHFSRWDTNNDDNLSQEEYYKATFLVLDENNDKELSTAETGWGYEHLYGDYVDYDVDVKEGERSTTVNYDQYRESVRDTKFYSESDTDSDSSLTRNELSASIFNNLDWDNDGSVTRSEFNQFSRYYISSENDSQY